MKANKFNTDDFVPSFSVDDKGQIVGVMCFDLVYAPKAQKADQRDSIIKLKSQIDRVDQLLYAFYSEQDLSESSVFSYIDRLNAIRKDIGYPLFEKSAYSARLVYDVIEGIISMQKDLDRWLSSKNNRLKYMENS